MSEAQRASRRTVDVFQQVEAQRAQLFRLATWIAWGGNAALMITFAVAGALEPTFPWIPLTLVSAFSILLTYVSRVLQDRGYLQWAITSFIIVLNLAIVLDVYFLGGVTGPFSMWLLALVVLAGLISGYQAVLWTAIGQSLVVVLLIFLEIAGLRPPSPLAGVVKWLVHGSTTLVLLGAVTLLVAQFIRQNERSLTLAQKRGEELAEETARAEEAARAERRVREREERTAFQLRQAVQQYTAFLERVIEGDYSARLALDETSAEAEEDVSEQLRVLGEYLNTTVESLVGALRDLQVIQKRYVRGAWADYVTTAAHRGFRYSEEDADIEPDDEAWLPAMAQAVEHQDVTAEGDELAFPITLRGEVIGAVGARRDGGDWSEGDRALAAAISDQLAQTIESLRLLDETQRRAAREQLVGEITGRVRESLDVDAVLQNAVREMRAALDLAEAEVRIMPSAVGDSTASPEEADQS